MQDLQLTSVMGQNEQDVILGRVLYALDVPNETS